MAEEKLWRPPGISAIAAEALDRRFAHRFSTAHHVGHLPFSQPQSQPDPPPLRRLFSHVAPRL